MSKLWIENISGIPAYAYQDENPDTENNTHYLDKTNDILSWHEYGAEVLDDNRTRYKIKAIMDSKVNPDLSNFTTALTLQEQLICVQRMLVPYFIRLSYVSDNDDRDNWKKLVAYTEGSQQSQLEGRSRIFEEMRVWVGEYVRTEFWNLPISDPAYNPKQSLEHSYQFYRDCHVIVGWYIKSNAPDFYQWITNAVGTPYENNGFQQAAYYNETLKGELVEIYFGEF